MRLVTGAFLSILILAGCAGVDSASPTPVPSAVSSPPPSSVPSASPASITVDQLAADAASLHGRVVTVKGFILATEVGASMCSLLLESYPPQCGGGIRVTGEIPADIAAGLDRTSEPGLAPAMWGTVEVTGTFDASEAGGTIALSGIRLAAP